MNFKTTTTTTTTRIISQFLDSKERDVIRGRIDQRNLETGAKPQISFSRAKQSNIGSRGPYLGGRHIEVELGGEYPSSADGIGGSRSVGKGGGG